MTEIVLDVVGVLVLLFAAALLVGLVTGRAKARSCCTLPADRDLRITAPREDPPAG